MIKSDNDILEAFKSGNQKAIDRSIDFVYRNHYEMIKKMVVSNSGNTTDADDLFQEALVIFYRNIQNGSFEGKSSIKTYFYAIARNIWFGQIRQSNKVEVLGLESIPEKMQPVENVQSDDPSLELQKIITDLLNKMSDACKSILTDFYYRNMSVEAIRENYKLASKQAAKTKKYRCLQKLINTFNSKIGQTQLS